MSNKGLNIKTLDYLRTCIEERDKIRGPRVGDYIFLLDGTIQRFSHDWGDSLQTSEGGSFCLSSDGLVSFSGGLNPSIPKNKIKETFVNYSDATDYNGMTGRFWIYYNGRLCHGSQTNVDLVCRVYKETN